MTVRLRAGRCSAAALRRGLAAARRESRASKGGGRHLIGALACCLAVLIPAAPARQQPPASLATGAPLDTSGFTYHRDIPAGEPGLAALTFDAAVLAHSRDNFADLRIVDAEGRQVPYLVHRLDKPLSIDLPPLDRDTSRGARDRTARESGTTSVYTVRLPFAHLPPASLVLVTSARVFRREVSLERAEGESDPEHRRSPAGLARQRWSHADGDTPAPDLTLDFDSVETSTIRLVVAEGDNAPLPLGRPTLLLPAYQARFFRRTGEKLELVYGNPGVDAPHYDLALVAPSLEDATARPVTAGPERSQTAPILHATRIFWIALVLTVVVLVALIARLLRRSSDAP